MPATESAASLRAVSRATRVFAVMEKSAFGTETSDLCVTWWRYGLQTWPDYGIGIVGKCLGPTRLRRRRGLRKIAAKYFEHALANESETLYAL